MVICSRRPVHGVMVHTQFSLCSYGAGKWRENISPEEELAWMVHSVCVGFCGGRNYGQSTSKERGQPSYDGFRCAEDFMQVLKVRIRFSAFF